MLLETLIPMSMLAISLSILALILLLAGRFLTSATLALISLAISYVAAVGWMNPQAIAGVNTLNQTAVIVTLQDEHVWSSLLQGSYS